MLALSVRGWTLGVWSPNDFCVLRAAFNPWGSCCPQLPKGQMQRTKFIFFGMWQIVRLLQQNCIVFQLNGQYTLHIAKHYLFTLSVAPSFYSAFILNNFFSSPPEFASYQSLKFESISVEAFTFGTDQYVVFAQPFAGTCSFLEWDHVEMTFRTYDTIESKSSKQSFQWWHFNKVQKWRT